MASVQVRYLAPICDVVGRFRDSLTTAEGDTTMDVIDRLCEQHGRPVRELFYDPKGAFRPMFIILRNARAMNVEDLRVPLEDGDRIAFVPPIAGG